jgi:hypothetical protein
VAVSGPLAHPGALAPASGSEPHTRRSAYGPYRWFPCRCHFHSIAPHQPTCYGGPRRTPPAAGCARLENERALRSSPELLPKLLIDVQPAKHASPPGGSSCG